MLSIVLTDALTVLVNHQTGLRKASKTAQAAAWQTVQLALADATSARAAMQRSAQQRSKQRKERGELATGRPPTVPYTVALGTLWQRRCMGTAAVHQMIAATLAKHAGNGPPPTIGSLRVTLSTKGTWWRKLETDDGTHDLTVQRLPADLA